MKYNSLGISMKFINILKNYRTDFDPSFDVCKLYLKLDKFDDFIIYLKHSK